MKRSKVYLIALAFLFLLISVMFLVYNKYYSPEVLTLKMYFETADKMGVNTDTDALYFGKAYPGSQVTSEINLTNNNEHTVFVAIKVTGNISQFISVSDNNFMLGPQEKKHLTYYLQTEEGTPFGNYSGETKIFISRKII